MLFLLCWIAVAAGTILRCSAAQSLTDGVSIPLIRVPRQPDASLRLVDSNVSVINTRDFAYLVRADVGGQKFLFLLDTGSSDLWVVSSSCSDSDCRSVPQYKPSATLSSSQTPFKLNYLLGSVAGNVGLETVNLGPFEISSQVFALANQTSGLGLAGTGNSGILGLSFAAEAAIPDTSGQTLLDNLLASFDDANRFFAYKLQRDQTGSSFTIGELDPTYANSTGDLVYTPVLPAYGSTYDYWKIPLHGLTINSTTFALSESHVHGSSTPIAVLDTGTTLVLGPSDDVDNFWASVGGARKTDSGWQVRCDRAVVIGFLLGEGDSIKEYLIDPADLSWDEGGREIDWCLGGIQANDNVSSGDWLLGDVFLRNVYAVHHGATSNQGPKIGLLGTTDPGSSLARFRAQRGDDPTPPVPVRAVVHRHQSHGLSGGAVCGISVASGFVFGVVLTIALYLCFCSSRLRKY